MKRKIFISIAVAIVILATFFPIHVEQGSFYNGIFQIGQGGYRITIGNLVGAADADYTCDGTDDNEQFQAALDALPAQGGQIFVVDVGNYTWADSETVTRDIDNVTIIGVSAGVNITGDGVNPLFTAGGNNWLFSNLKTDSGGLDMGATSDWMWLNVVTNSTYYPLRTDGINIEDHSSRHGVGGADTVFPADPDADKYLMWDDDPGQLSWEDAGTGEGDMLKSTYDTDEDGDIDTSAGGTEWDSSAATGVAYITAGAWGTRDTGISNTYILIVDDADAADNDFAKFTAAGLEGRDYSEVRSDLSLVLGVDIQAYDAELAALAGLTSAADKVIYFTGSGTADTTDFTAFARSILDDMDEATFKATVNLEIGTDVQAWDTDLDDIATLSDADSNFIVGNGANWVVESGATVRASLGLVIGTDVQAYDAELAALAGLTSAADKVPYFTGSETASVADLTSYGRSIIATVNEAGFKQFVNLEIGTDVQAWDDDLDDIAALTPNNGNFIVGNGTDWTARNLTEPDIPDEICRDDEIPTGTNITALEEKTSPTVDDIIIVVDVAEDPDEVKQAEIGNLPFLLYPTGTAEWENRSYEGWEVVDTATTYTIHSSTGDFATLNDCADSLKGLILLSAVTIQLQEAQTITDPCVFSEMISSGGYILLDLNNYDITVNVDGAHEAGIHVSCPIEFYPRDVTGDPEASIKAGGSISSTASLLRFNYASRGNLYAIDLDAQSETFNYMVRVSNFSRLLVYSATTFSDTGGGGNYADAIGIASGGFVASSVTMGVVSDDLNIASGGMAIDSAGHIHTAAGQIDDTEVFGTAI